MNVGPQVSPMGFRGTPQEVVDEGLKRLRKQRALIEALATAAANYFAADIDEQIEQLTQTQHQIVTKVQPEYKHGAQYSPYPYGGEPTVEDLMAVTDERVLLEESLQRLEETLGDMDEEAKDSPMRQAMSAQYAMGKPLLTQQLHAAKAKEKNIQQYLERKQAQGASTQTAVADPEGEKP